MRRVVARFDLSSALREKINWFRPRLRKWYKTNHRSFSWREPQRTPYEVLIAEVLLRRTQARTVPPVYSVFLKKYPNFTALAAASKRDLHRLLKPLGLWRQKTPILVDLAKRAEQNRGGLPLTRSDLEALPHIGNYIASVILTTFHNKAEPFVDVNMARIVDRFFGPRKLVDLRDDPYLHAVSREIVKNPNESLQLNWAILDFAALVCKAGKPRCEICPMRKKCLFFSQISTGAGQLL